MRDKIGSFTSRKEIEMFLNRWITGYVTEDELVAGIRERRAVAEYWEAADVVPDRDPAVVFVVANAAYRAAQHERDRVEAVTNA